MGKTFFIVSIMVILVLNGQSQTVTDFDGNVYDTIHIGTQIWLKPNLKVTHYRNGDPIPNVTDSAIWYNLTSGAYCNYDNDSGNAAIYGRLYNWYAVNDPRGISPVGWRVPTFEDWDTLQIFLGYDLVAGGKLKEMGTAHWMFPNTGASDEYDFTARPGGQRADSIYSGTFSEITQQGYWWSSSEMDTVYPWAANISYNSAGYNNWAASTRKSGFSVRLIMDYATGIDRLDPGSYLKLFPNPARDYLIIELPFSGKEDAIVTLYDLTGKIIPMVILNKSILSQKEKLEVNVRDMAAGIYLVQMKTEKLIETKKVIISK